MATSRWADVVNGLVDAMRAQPGYRTPGSDGDSTGVLVLDGIEAVLTEDLAQRLLIVGGTPDDEEDPGDIGQSVATLGTSRSRDENGSILCSAIAQIGSAELPDSTVVVQRQTARTLRADAFGVMAGVETVLRSNPTLGLAIGQHLDAEIGERMSVQQFVNDDGAACVVRFAVKFTARI